MSATGTAVLLGEVDANEEFVTLGPMLGAKEHAAIRIEKVGKADQYWSGGYTVQVSGVTEPAIAVHAPQPDLSEYTERHGEDLVRFIVGNLDTEEQARYVSQLVAAALDALETRDLLPLARLFGDWEETVALKLDPVLSREIAMAFDEAGSRLPAGEKG